MDAQVRNWEPYIYFLQQLREPRRIKIGYSRRPAQRRRDLERSHGPLQDLGRYPGDQPAERALHRRFHYLHAGAEWFEPAPELLRYIEAQVVAPWERDDENPLPSAGVPD